MVVVKSIPFSNEQGAEQNTEHPTWMQASHVPRQKQWAKPEKILTHLGLFWESPEPNQPLSLPSDVEAAWLESDLAGRESLLPPENNVFLNFLPLSGDSAAAGTVGVVACMGQPPGWACWIGVVDGWASFSSSFSSFFILSKDQRRPSAKEPLSSLCLVRFCSERESGEHFSSRTSLDGRAPELFGVDGSDS